MTGFNASMATYQQGFSGGLTVRGMPLNIAHPGKVFWVGNANTAYPNRKTSSDTANKGGFLDPFATADKATNSCVASRGDIVMFLPGHTETLVSATTWATDVAGVAYVGLGAGVDRPTFTCSTGTDAGIAITGASSSFHNLVFVSNMATGVAMITTGATDITLSGLELREGALGFLTAITIGQANNDSDRLEIVGCKVRFNITTTNVGNAAVEFAFDADYVMIRDSDMQGDFDDAVISVPAAGDLSKNLTIRDSFFKNELVATNVGELVVEVTTGGTTSGQIVNCDLISGGTHTLTVLAAGLLSVSNCRGNSGGNGNGWYKLGDNLGERGSRITRVNTTTAQFASSSYAQAGNTVIFAVTGDIACRATAIVNTALASDGATGDLTLGVAGALSVLLPLEVVATGAIAVAGSVWGKTNIAALAQEQLGAGAWVILGGDTDIICTIANEDMASGDLDWYLEWYPLSADGAVVPGAQA